MKKLLCLVLVLCMMPVMSIAESFYEAVDSMSLEELKEVYSYIAQKIESAEDNNATDLSAKDIMEALIAAGFPLYGYVDYTEETDVNKLLGRPNQYTSKCNAYERRITTNGKDDPSDVAIEVFNSSKDCQARYDYIMALSPAILHQYVHMNGNVLFRVDNDLLPSEAKEYEEALGSIIAGTTYEIVIDDETKESATVEDTDFFVTSRKEPASVGQRVLFEDAAITVLNAFVGEKANAIARSFDSYNTRSYTMEKNEEWMLVFIKIEGFETLEDTAYLSSYDFSVVSKDGVVLDDGYAYLSGNPREITNLISDSVQYCWYGAPIAKGSEPLLFFENYEFGEAWFDVSTRVPADTSNETYKLLQRNDTGLLVDRVQIALYDYGYRKNVPDGSYGNATAQSIKAFQTDCGLEPTGQTDDETLRWLLSGKPVPEK